MRPVLTESDIPQSGELRIARGSIVTPSAADAARDRGVRIVEVEPAEVSGAAKPETTVALGSDHAGFEAKQGLLWVFEEMGLHVRDLGVHENQTADYPDIAAAVAELVASGATTRGVIIDGSGVGSAMAANKVPGVRAALCYDDASARQSREYNDANVLALGGKLQTLSQAEAVLRAWLSASFSGGRHTARVEKITAIERRYSVRF